jgi:hypothetical protein
MKRVERDEWVAALRSGKFRQAREQLCKQQVGGAAYCCLGVKAVLDVRAGRAVEDEGGLFIYGEDYYGNPQECET